MRVAHSIVAALVLCIVALAAPASAGNAEGGGVAPCGVHYEPSTSTAIAQALIFPSSGRVVIIYNPVFINWAERRGLGAPMFRYLMQHECGHHVLGHITALAAGVRMIGAASRRLELEADCYAARRLAAAGDILALQAALMIWNSMGDQETGPYHPKGFDRSAMLSSCYAGGGPPGGF